MFCKRLNCARLSYRQAIGLALIQIAMVWYFSVSADNTQAANDIPDDRYGEAHSTVAAVAELLTPRLTAAAGKVPGRSPNSECRAGWTGFHPMPPGHHDHRAPRAMYCRRA